MTINRFINFERLLTLNYKKIGLSDDEFVLLSITYELVQSGTTFVNPSDLALLCNYSTTKIDVVYSGLIAKRLISNEFNAQGTIYTSFDGIVNELLKCLNSEIDTQKEKGGKVKKEENVDSYMQAFFNRPLSPLEFDVIQSWKDKNYSFALIKAACEIASKSGNKSIRYIDTIMFEETKKAEIGAEEYQKQEQETIEISSIDWLNK